jgi:hypothetical protein
MFWHNIGNRACSTEIKHEYCRALFSMRGEIRLCYHGTGVCENIHSNSVSNIHILTINIHIPTLNIHVPILIQPSFELDIQYSVSNLTLHGREHAPGPRVRFLRHRCSSTHSMCTGCIKKKQSNFSVLLRAQYWVQRSIWMRPIITIIII